MTTFMVRIRKDGTILIPKEAGWNPGEMLELTDWGQGGSVVMLNIRRNFERMKAENKRR